MSLLLTYKTLETILLITQLKIARLGWRETDCIDWTGSARFVVRFSRRRAWRSFLHRVLEFARRSDAEARVKKAFAPIAALGYCLLDVDVPNRWLGAASS